MSEARQDIVPSDQVPTTLASVAASAGVSIATVSKVLNGRADVAPETRARVQILLQEQEYVGRRAEPAGRMPAEQQTVELVFHGRLTSYSMVILQGVLDAATESGIAVVVSVRPRQLTRASAVRPAAWVRHLTKAGRRAVIDVVDDVRQGDLTALSRAHLPLVVIDPLTLPRRQVTSVGSTNFAGGVAATEHLLTLGHSRIAYLGAEATFPYNLARMHGYRAALEAAGIDIPAEYVRSASSQFQAGVVGGTELLNLPQRPTAIVAATDEIAAGVVEAARARALRVPEDVSIVGFNDTDLARLLSPPLTTIHQPLREMGRVALRTALKLAAGEQLDSHHVELATELVVRSSTAPPPK
jgi:LacI family transcriptional regulator